jgi:tetrapyrrole methylase family protein/MazG family protein
MRQFDELVEIMARLRGPQGCPWDHEQSHETLTRHLLEETYELLEAIEGGADPALCEELGDVLLQIVFHAQIAAEEDRFTIADVLERINEKLRYRHPHVFGEVEVADSAEVLHNWEELKQAEEDKPARESALDGVPAALPALQRAEKLQKRASRVGFDWDEASGPRAKVEEELAELDEARAQGDPLRVAEEMGDLLFAIVNLTRFCGVHAEEALREANRRFTRRFEAVERAVAAAGQDLADLTLEELEDLWQDAKAEAAS